jgi:hypothetical protein
MLSFLLSFHVRHSNLVLIEITGSLRAHHFSWGFVFHPLEMARTLQEYTAAVVLRLDTKYSVVTFRVMGGEVMRLNRLGSYFS